MDIPDDVLGYLVSKGLNPRSASRDEVNLPCFLHGEQAKGRERGRLYVNVSNDPAVAGLYFCHVCGQKGNIITLMRHFGDEPPRPEKDDENWHLRHEILRSAAEYYQSRLQTDHVKWLREERGLKPLTIQKHQIGWADGGLYKHLRDAGYELNDMLRTGLIAVDKDDLQADGTFVLDGAKSRPYDFLRDCITIPYHVAGNVVQVRGKRLDGKYLTPPRQEARLFNTDALWDAETAVVTEGEFDALVLEQMGYAVTGSPGAKTWQDSWDGYFDGMKRVYIAFDNDPPGQIGADAVKDRLGRKARSVLLPENDYKPGTKNDITDHFVKAGHDPDEFAQMLRKADKAGTLLVTADDAFEEWASLQGVSGLRYGFEEFDDYMRPGHLATKVWIVLAKTNTGKTLFLQNIFQGITRVPGQEDFKILYVSLEQTRGDWFERARRIWNFWNQDCPAQEVNAETLNFWRDRILITDVNRMGVEELCAAIQDFKDHFGKLPDLVAIDYLGYWARSFKGLSKYEQVSEAVASLKEVGKLQRVPVLAPHQVSRTQDFGKELEVDSGRDSGAIEEYADDVFLLWNPDTAAGVELGNRTGRVKCKIGKTRAGSKGRVADFQFGYLSLAMAPLGDPAARMLVDEIEFDNRDDSAHILGVEKWEAAIYRHRTGIKNGDISEALLAERGL